MKIGETSTANESPARALWKRTQRADNSIFRVPAHMRYNRKNDIEPKLVAIGPYHHGHEKFKPMEELKHKCVQYLLRKNPDAGSTQLVQEFMVLERDARLFYKENVHHGDVDFVEMLVNDSCFIIRVMLSLSQQVQESMAFLDVNIKEVRSDLLLLENQIPLFFIKEVYKKIFPSTANPTPPHFETVLETFIWLDVPWRINYHGMFGKAVHLLDLYWRCSTSETVNNFGSCFEKVINEPLINFQSGYLHTINEQKKNIDSESGNLHPIIGHIDSPFYSNMMYVLENLQSNFQKARDEHAFPSEIYEIVKFHIADFHRSFNLAVAEEVHTIRYQDLPYCRDNFDQLIIQQLITFRNGILKQIDEQRQRHLLHEEVDGFGTCGRPLARIVQLNNTRIDIGQEMNEKLNYLSSGFDQVINELLLQFGRPGFQQEQRSLAEIYCPTNAPKVIANATVLHQTAGIKFEKLNDEHHHDGLHVIFSNGIMQMPCLKIDSSQITLLVNLITYENSKLPSKRTFNSYIKLMDALIDSEKDVELLQQSGVISNTLSSHKMAATFFNDIGNFCLIDYESNCFSGLYENVPKYYNSIWNRSWATLRQNYFSSPWTGISVFAGVTLLILTVLQTFYTIYGYYKPKH